MRQYKCLQTNEFHLGEYSIVPIRDEDKFQIMDWRNEQMDHLRQSKPLTTEGQLDYFKHTIEKLFENPNPGQLLFSFLKNNSFIGYGGLVHINWQDKNAEISFLISSALDKNIEKLYWMNFLQLIEMVGFTGLNFHKIYAYAFDIRPHLYSHLIESGFTLEARLKEHYWLKNKYFDVVIHSKFNRVND